MTKILNTRNGSELRRMVYQLLQVRFHHATVAIAPVSRANDCARNYLLRARVTRDANDVTPICPTISLRSRGNQYNDAFLSSVKLLRSARTNRDPRTRESIHHQ